MTDHDALLAAVKAAPDDDRPRLVYADWLEDRGEHERAEFIRVQCELAGRICLTAVALPEVAGLCRCRVCALRRRERELWVGRDGEPFNSLLWFPECRSISLRCGEDVCRGFLNSLRCPSADWLRLGDAITAAHPLRAVRLTDRPRVVLCSPGSALYRLDGREAFMPEQPGPTVPWVGDGQLYPTVRPPTPEELLAVEWPGIAFEVPPAGWTGWTIDPATMTDVFTNADARRAWNVMMFGNPDGLPPAEMTHFLPPR